MAAYLELHRELAFRLREAARELAEVARAVALEEALADVEPVSDPSADSPESTEAQVAAELEEPRLEGLQVDMNGIHILDRWDIDDVLAEDPQVLQYVLDESGARLLFESSSESD